MSWLPGRHRHSAERASQSCDRLRTHLVHKVNGQMSIKLYIAEAAMSYNQPFRAPRSRITNCPSRVKVTSACRRLMMSFFPLSNTLNVKSLGDEVDSRPMDNLLLLSGISAGITPISFSVLGFSTSLAITAGQLIVQIYPFLVQIIFTILHVLFCRSETARVIIVIWVSVCKHHIDCPLI